MLASGAEAGAVRRAEQAVNDLWRVWSAKYPRKGPSQVLAMVAYRYAQFYLNEREAAQQTQQWLQQFDLELDAMLG